MEIDKKEMLGLYAGIGDVIENGNRLGECIFNLEIVLTGKIEAEGVFVKFTDGDINFAGREATFKISGIISRDHTYYMTEFTAFTNPQIYPKFIVPNPDEIFENLQEGKDSETDS
ncbi:MAG: hypothetical protein J7K61_02115 [Thermoplasmata archaeon]|nr:hypothetical protein [Thermoplasmata archaeon]